MKSLQPRQAITSVSKQRLMRIPNSVRMVVAPVVRGFRSGNNDAIQMIGMRAIIVAERSATPNGPDTQPNTGLNSGQDTHH